MQMSSLTIATNTLCTNIADLLAYLTIVHVGRDQTEDIEQEIAILMHSQNNIIQPLYNYYCSVESQLCDVPEDIHDLDHDSGPPCNHLIDELSDYQALHYTNFTKPQLKRLYRCFKFGNEMIRLHCSQGHCYQFHPQYIIYLTWSRLLLVWIIYPYVICCSAGPRDECPMHLNVS